MVKAEIKGIHVYEVARAFLVETNRSSKKYYLLLAARNNPFSNTSRFKFEDYDSAIKKLVNIFWEWGGKLDSSEFSEMVSRVVDDFLYGKFRPEWVVRGITSSRIWMMERGTSKQYTIKVNV